MASAEYRNYEPSPPQLQEQDLEGKVAVVTGATKGIGRAIALHLASRGCSILGTYTSPQSAHNFDTLSHTIASLYSTPSPSPSQTAPPTPPKILALVSGSHFSPSSRIVLLSSDRVRDPSPGSSIFNVCKAGFESLARSWALELPPHFPGTTVNAVSVGLTDTPGLRAFPAAAVEALKAARVPKVKVVEGGRMGWPEDVAEVVGWLCSERSRWVTGSVVAANGGAEWVGGSS
ncbi:NAD(P)-binding protein [Amniculicola lignicola CBS 123094]|uniref:NAD(P)-binding protein n=1 Tax=Amniculicola lignicola CBS 123094 TaxID=1392246 RepID=A0A6A5VZ41_9PLEO|nr:NAD(P)-binding protein [Amniculicola lignicola CBS 123094]